MEEERKLAKKVRRKRAQFAALEPSMATQVTFIESASLADEEKGAKTYYLFIGNGGTQNGVSRDLLRELLEGLDMLCMPESKDFSFASVHGAERALKVLKYNGLCVQDQCRERGMSHLINPSLMTGPPLHLYISLVDQIPPSLLEDHALRNTTTTHIYPPGLLLIIEFITVGEEIELLKYFTGGGGGGGGERMDHILTGDSDILTHVTKDDHILAGDSDILTHMTHDDHISTQVKQDSDMLMQLKQDNHVLTCLENGDQELTHVHQELTHHVEQSECESVNVEHILPCPVEGVLKNRTVQHYGYEFLYGSSQVDCDQPLPGGLPSVVIPLLRRVMERGLLPWLPDQLTVNEYLPGAGIPSHVDTHSPFEDGILSLSLLSAVVMEFKHPNGDRLPVYLPPRSLLVMKGPSRYLWTHGITPRKSDTIHPHMLAPPSHTPSPRSHTPSLPHSTGFTVVPRGKRVSLTFRKTILLNVIHRQLESVNMESVYIIS